MSRRISPLRDFLNRESTSGLLIVAASLFGVLIANSPLSDYYFSTLDFHLSIGADWYLLDLSILKVINYLLMSIFFFVVGLEIKRELTTGHLASFKKALLPFVADVVLRKKAYSEKDLFESNGIYGSVNKGSIFLMGVGSIIGWGFVTNTFAPWLEWQGYLLRFIGGKDGAWAYSNLGVIFALLIGFCGHIILSARKIKAQESLLS